MRYDRKFLLSALCYAAMGMGVGIYMAASQNHTQHVSHAHILLVGFVLSLIYGVIHKLWLSRPAPALALAQFVVHHAGAIVMSVGLLLLYGNRVAEAQIGSVLGAASVAVLIGILLMLTMVLKTNPKNTQ